MFGLALTRPTTSKGPPDGGPSLTDLGGWLPGQILKQPRLGV